MASSNFSAEARRCFPPRRRCGTIQVSLAANCNATRSSVYIALSLLVSRFYGPLSCNAIATSKPPPPLTNFQWKQPAASKNSERQRIKSRIQATYRDSAATARTSGSIRSPTLSLHAHLFALFPFVPNHFSS